MSRELFYHSHKTSKSQAVYEALRRMIVLGQLRPAEPIAEMQIAHEFACSQGPVREALLRLQEEGLVNRMSYHGTVVSAITQTEVHEFTVLRKLLETRALVLAFDQFDEAALARLTALIEAMEAAAIAEDQFGLSEIDREFHIELFRQAHIDALEPVLHRCLLQVHRHKIALSPGVSALKQSARSHWAILDALRQGKPSAAKRLLSEHAETVYGMRAQRLARPPERRRRRPTAPTPRVPAAGN